MGRPSFTVSGIFMGDDANAGQGKGCAVEIKIAIEIGPS
jgi:hypothetical protein